MATQRSGDIKLKVFVQKRHIEAAGNTGPTLAVALALKEGDQVSDVSLVDFATGSPQFNIDGITYFTDGGNYSVATLELQGQKPIVEYYAYFNANTPVITPY